MYAVNFEFDGDGLDALELLKAPTLLDLPIPARHRSARIRGLLLQPTELQPHRNPSAEVGILWSTLLVTALSVIGSVST